MRKNTSEQNKIIDFRRLVKILLNREVSKMNCNTQNAKIASITEKTLIVGIDVGSETHYVRAFGWRNYEYTKKPLGFSNTEAGFQTFKAWIHGGETRQNCCNPWHGADRPLLVRPGDIPAR